MADFSRSFKLLMNKDKKKESKIEKINRRTRSKMKSEDSARMERVKKALKGKK